MTSNAHCALSGSSQQVTHHGKRSAILNRTCQRTSTCRYSLQWFMVCSRMQTRRLALYEWSFADIDGTFNCVVTLDTLKNVGIRSFFSFFCLIFHSFEVHVFRDARFILRLDLNKLKSYKWL